MASSNRDDGELIKDLDINEDSDGWDDVEDDTEQVSLKCLCCPQTLPTIDLLLSHSKESHSIDLIAIKQQYDLDFYSTIKLINYIRTQEAAGQPLDFSSKMSWQDDKYLQPVLPDDALLFSIDELDLSQDVASEQRVTSKSDASIISELKDQLVQLQSQFDAYRAEVSKTFEQQLAEPEPVAESTSRADKYDEEYFQGYSYNDIHQTMLQDTIRTDAYRDFIYDNKHLFKDKVVMDVGCGTGILSFFCARAGAKKVIAVDNSAIIDKAREIAASNNLLDQVTFVKSKVENIKTLPDGLKHVDIIVSEWMGYCLFFEAMLPSVLVARDRFLKRAADGTTFDGLIVPSHCSLQIAPLSDPDWMTDNVSFWSDVYGFNMDCMMEKAFEDVVVQFPPAKSISGSSSSGQDLRVWDLYTTKIEDLQFVTTFSINVTKDIDEMDSWCIWFDIGFSPKLPTSEPTLFTSCSEVFKQPGAVMFTTSPASKRTHWNTGVCVIEPGPVEAHKLQVGDVITGSLRYAKGEESRALEIEVKWKTTHDELENKKVWKIR